MVVTGKTRPDWYVDAFDVRSTQLPWNESTEEDVERVLKILDPRGEERLLDLGCGHGRHAVELASRGFEVVGVDLNEELINIAIEDALELDAEFHLADLRGVSFAAEFDLALSLNSPIGYLEDDEQNRRALETIARALRPGGRSLMQIPNVRRAEARPNERSWSLGTDFAELVERRWDPTERRVEGLVMPIELHGSFCEQEPIAFSQRLYSLDELDQLLGPLGMSIDAAYDEAGNPWDPSPEHLDIFVVANKD